MTLQPSSSADLVGFICCKTSKERCHWDFWSSSVALQPGKFGVFFRKNEKTCGENHQNMDKSKENHELLFQNAWCVARFFPWLFFYWKLWGTQLQSWGYFRASFCLPLHMAYIVTPKKIEELYIMISMLVRFYFCIFGGLLYPLAI